MKRTILHWDQIEDWLRHTSWPNVDVVVGIGRSGLVPAAWLARHLQLPLHILSLRLYEDGPMPKALFAEPVEQDNEKIEVKEKRVLLIDDLVNTGRTFIHAKKILHEAKEIITVSLVGQADISMFEKIDCPKFPWSQ